MKRLGFQLFLFFALCTTWLSAQRKPNAPPPASDGKLVKVSFYSNKYNGRVTASRERFSNEALTAAHRELPFGTKVKLTNPANNRSVVVRVNDRGPFVPGRDISITRRAARQLGFLKSGLMEANMIVLNTGRP